MGLIFGILGIYPKNPKNQSHLKNQFGERLFQRFLDILFGKNQKNVLFLPQITQIFHEFQADWFEKIGVIRGKINLEKIKKTSFLKYYFFFRKIKSPPSLPEFGKAPCCGTKPFCITGAFIRSNKVRAANLVSLLERNCSNKV
jgi:hypothetical protein